MTRPPRGDALNAVDDAPVRSRLGIDKDRPDYTVFNGEWRSAASTRPVAVPTICAGSGRCPMTRSNGVTTLETPISEELGCLEGMGE